MIVYHLWTVNLKSSLFIYVNTASVRGVTLCREEGAIAKLQCEGDIEQRPNPSQVAASASWKQTSAGFCELQTV